MLFALVLCGLVVCSMGDHNHETDNAGNCRDMCEEDMCSSGPSPDDRLCSAFDVNEVRISVDPFQCGEPRCQQVECGDCGDQDHCVELCQEFKDINDINGYPNCATVCAAVDEDFKCFQRCGHYPEIFAKPKCDQYLCEEAYCTAQGRQTCSAQSYLVDPLGCADTSCGDVQCSQCGAQDDCVTHCDRYNRDNNADIDCETECRKVEGYKCWTDC